MGASIKLAVAGSSGRMGRTIIEAALAFSDLKIVSALDRADSPDLGQDCAQFLGQRIGVPIVSDLAAIRNADVLIDFTRPEATLEHLRVCVEGKVRAVIGTTGFDEAGTAALAQAAQKTAIVAAPNMSVGVQALARVVELAASILGSEYDVEIIEAHHKHKVDAPSGTALQLGEAAARARGQGLESAGVYARHGITGARKAGTIGFTSIRGGDIIGDHTVLFAGAGERIEITHRSTSRVAYAQGALRAARFLQDKKSGLFRMRDVLGA